MNTEIATKREIKIRLLERETSVPQIARKTKVTPEAIYQALRGEIKSDRLRNAITSALGWPASRIWGA